MDVKGIDEFEKVEGQLMGFHQEVQNLAKKSPDDGVNKFKLRHINSLRTSQELVYLISMTPVLIILHQCSRCQSFL